MWTAYVHVHLEFLFGRGGRIPGLWIVVTVADIFWSRFHLRDIFRRLLFTCALFFAWGRYGLDRRTAIDENAMGDELRGSGGPPALPLASTDPPRP